MNETRPASPIPCVHTIRVYHRLLYTLSRYTLHREVVQNLLPIYSADRVRLKIAVPYRWRIVHADDNRKKQRLLSSTSPQVSTRFHSMIQYCFLFFLNTSVKSGTLHGSLAGRKRPILGLGLRMRGPQFVTRDENERTDAKLKVMSRCIIFWCTFFFFFEETRYDWRFAIWMIKVGIINWRYSLSRSIFDDVDTLRDAQGEATCCWRCYTYYNVWEGYHWSWNEIASRDAECGSYIRCTTLHYAIQTKCWRNAVSQGRFSRFFVAAYISKKENFQLLYSVPSSEKLFTPCLYIKYKL